MGIGNGRGDGELDGVEELEGLVAGVAVAATLDGAAVVLLAGAEGAAAESAEGRGLGPGSAGVTRGVGDGDTWCPFVVG